MFVQLSESDDGSLRIHVNLERVRYIRVDANGGSRVYFSESEMIRVSESPEEIFECARLEKADEEE